MSVSTSDEPITTPIPTTRPTSRLSDELRSLAKDEAFETRAVHLNQIAGVLEGAPGVEQWAEVDVLTVLDVDGPLGGVKEESAWSQRLEMLRTFFIFCPLMVTWLGLFLASRAYSSLIASDPVAAREPFLKLWLSGFHGRTAFSLEAMALTSAVLIGLLVAVSILLERQHQKDDGLFESFNQKKRQSLRSAAISAQLQLVHHRFSSPERFREELTRGASVFGSLIQQITYMANVVNTSLSGLGPVAERLDGAAKSSATAVHDVASSATRIADLITHLEATLVAASTQVESAMNQSSQHVAQHVATAAVTVDRALQQGNQLLAGQVESSASWIVGAAEALLAQSDQALAASTRTYDEVKRAVTDVYGRVDEAMSKDANAAALLHQSERAAAEIAATKEAIARLTTVIGTLPRQHSDATEALLQRAATALEAAGARLNQIAIAEQGRPVGVPTGYVAR